LASTRARNMLNLRSGKLFPVWCGGMCHVHHGRVQPNQTSIPHHPRMRTLIQHKGQVHLQPSQQAPTPDFHNLLWPSNFQFYGNVLNSLTRGQPCQWRASWQLAPLGNNTILESMLIPLWGPGIPRSTLGAAATRRLLWNHVWKRNLRCEARQGGPPEGTGQVVHPHGISAWAIICGHCVGQRAVLYTTHQEVVVNINLFGCRGRLVFPSCQCRTFLHVNTSCTTAVTSFLQFFVQRWPSHLSNLFNFSNNT
jgi:hypothetical protein